MCRALRIFRVLAAAALVPVSLLSCTSSPGAAASDARLASASPIASNPTDSEAAGLRTQLDLLLGEQVIVIAKESSAAHRSGEYISYLLLLTSNGNDLTELVRSALGDAAASRFDQIWMAQDDDLVNYTIGLVTHNPSTADAAISGLLNAFVPQFSQFLSTVTQIPLKTIAQLATEHVLETKAILNDQIAHDFTKMYADLGKAYAHASSIGDALASAIVQKFPDKFPGNASSPAVNLRVSVNSLLQEHVYLATMTTGAATGHRVTEEAAAARALAENTAALGSVFAGLFGAPVGTLFDQLWAAKNLATIGYASASTGTAKQRALNQLNDAFVTKFPIFVQDSTGLAAGTLRSAIEAQVAATITVIDDQRSGSLARLGADDRSADASMEVVADLLASAIAAKLPARF
jgi:hypothetical protein